MSRLFPKLAGLHWPTVALAAGLGLAGGALAHRLGLPLPWLLGSLAATATAGIAGVAPFGRPLALPEGLRLVFVPVIGVSIGAAVTPDLARALTAWLPSLLALLIYIPAAHAIGFTLAMRRSGMDATTAYFGTMPGGFIEAIAMGDVAGADRALLSVMQLMRLILCIVGIPVGITLITGETVGSATGRVLGDVPLSATDWVILAVAGLVGALAGRRLGLPAGIVLGPTLVSGMVHLLGWVEGGPPRWLIDLTQLVVGTTLGSRFAGRSPRVLMRAAGVTVLTVSSTLALAATAALLIHGWVGESWQAVFLAFAPGGLAEMSLVALSLEISVIYVTAHHVLRILLSVAFAKAGARWFVRPDSAERAPDRD